MSRPIPIPAPVALGVTLLCLTLLTTGCDKAPGPVLDMKISAGDWKDYTDSLQAIAGRQTAEERTEFEKALQELKYHVISGEGLSIKLGRKQEEEKALVRSIVMNDRLRTKPGDEASGDFLESVRRGQAKQLKALRDEISALTKRIEELGPPRSPRPF